MKTMLAMVAMGMMVGCGGAGFEPSAGQDLSVAGDGGMTEDARDPYDGHLVLTLPDGATLANGCKQGFVTVCAPACQDSGLSVQYVCPPGVYLAGSRGCQRPLCSGGDIRLSNAPGDVESSWCCPE
jgi:hypothetical protein